MNRGTLNGLAPSSLRLPNRKIVGNADPEYSQDSATKNYADRDLPAYVRSLTNGKTKNSYFPRLNLYNGKSKNTRKTVASLSKARLGQLRADWLFIGDSETDNFIGAGGSAPFGGSGFDWMHMWPRRLLDAMTNANVPNAGSGFVRFGTGAGATADPRWTTVGSWTRAAGLMYGYSTTPGNTATLLTIDGPGTNVDIEYTNQSAAMNYSVKDAAGTVLASGALTITGAASLAKLSLTGLVNAVSVTLTHNGSAGQFAILLGAAIYNTTGLHINNLAMYGSSAAGTNGWADTTTNYYNYLNVALHAVPSPQAAFVALGVNDLGAGYGIPDIVAAMRVIKAALPSTCDMWLIGQYQPLGVTQSRWENYLANLYLVADVIDVPVADLYDRSGGYTEANANGMMGDPTHPSAAAQIDWGTLIANIISSAQDQSSAVVPLITPSFTYSGTLAVTTDATSTTAKWRNATGRTLTFKKIVLDVVSAPTGAAIIVDLNKNGTTMFTTQANRPQIAISAVTGSSVNPDVLTVADGDYITVNIDQIGSTLPGTTLTATVVFG